jgi:hypothetical protein
MMRTKLHWALVATLCAALFGGWLWLFTLAHRADAGQQAGVEQMVLQLKEADAQWNAELLKSQTDLSVNYDALVQPLQRLVALRDALLDAPDVVGNAATSAAVASMSKAIDDKAALIDRFKSGHALLRNSLRYLPTVRLDFQATLDAPQGADAAAPRAVRATPAALESGVNRLLSDVMRYNMAPDTEIASAIAIRVSSLQQEALALPGAQRENMLNLVSHAKTVLNERPRVMTTLDKVFRAPVGAEIDNVRTSLGHRLQQHADSEDRYRLMLLVYTAVALVLAAMVGAWGARASRSASAIR